MDNKEAIEVLRKNYPSSNYTMLIEAVELSIKSLQAAESAQTAHNKPMPKLPTLEEVYTSIQCGPYCELSYRERHVLEACYEFIGRQLSA